MPGLHIQGIHRHDKFAAVAWTSTFLKNFGHLKYGMPPGAFAVPKWKQSLVLGSTCGSTSLSMASLGRSAGACRA